MVELKTFIKKGILLFQGILLRGNRVKGVQNEENLKNLKDLKNLKNLKDLKDLNLKENKFFKLSNIMGKNIYLYYINGTNWWRMD